MILILLISIQDARNVQHKFAAETIPTLYNVLPAVEELLTAWGSKIYDPCYTIFVNALEVGIDKLQKYYNWFDLKPAILINLGKLFWDDPYQLIWNGGSSSPLF